MGSLGCYSIGRYLDRNNIRSKANTTLYWKLVAAKAMKAALLAVGLTIICFFK